MLCLIFMVLLINIIKFINNSNLYTFRMSFYQLENLQHATQTTWDMSSYENDCSVSGWFFLYHVLRMDALKLVSTIGNNSSFGQSASDIIHVEDEEVSLTPIRKTWRFYKWCLETFDEKEGIKNILYIEQKIIYTREISLTLISRGLRFMWSLISSELILEIPVIWFHIYFCSFMRISNRVKFMLNLREFHVKFVWCEFYVTF